MNSTPGHQPHQCASWSMSVVAIPSPPDAVITNRGIREDMCNCACIRQQLSQLLQQPVVQAYRYTEPTIQIECSHNATWVVQGAKQCDHITLVLCKLHWMLVHQRIMFKLMMTVQVPQRVGVTWLLTTVCSSYLWPVDGTRAADTCKLVVQRRRTVLVTMDMQSSVQFFVTH